MLICNNNSNASTARKCEKSLTKILSLILSFLVIFFMIPVVSYAEMIETAEELLSGTSDETAEEEPSLSYTSEDPAYELTEMREERSKYFRLEDGTYVVANYEYPVHVMQNGEWVDIDNSLTDNGNDIFTGNARVKFSKKITGNGNIFTLHENNMKISLALIGAIKKTEGKIVHSGKSKGEEEKTLGKLISLEGITSKVVYEEILEGVDIEYVLESTNLKENIIVKEQSAEGYSYSFELSLNNLTASLSSEGDVYLKDKNGTTIYTIPAPIVFDGNGVYADAGNASQTLEFMGNDKCILTVSVDDEWMNAEDRAYPVTVDPTLGVAESSVIDLYIDSEKPFENYLDDAYLSVKDTHYAYWKIKNDCLPSIPSSAYITSAVLQFGAYGHGYVGACVVSSLWDEDLTYYDTLDRYIGCETESGIAKINYTSVSSGY